MALCRRVRNIFSERQHEERNVAAKPLDLNPYLNKYVAIYHGRVVASSGTFGETMKSARKCGGAPLIFYVSERTLDKRTSLVHLG